MATVSTFGVNAAVVRRYSGAYVVGANTPVTTDMLAELISDAAAVECAYLDSIGGSGYAATLAADSSTQVYRLVQQLIARVVAVDLATSWEGAGRHPEIIGARRSELEAMRKEYRERIASLGDGRPTGDNAPGLVRSHVTMRSSITEALRTAPLSARLAWKREV